MLRYAQRLLLPVFGMSLALLCHPGIASARDNPKNNATEKRAQLAAIHRVVVIPPFFGTDTLSKAAKLTAKKTEDGSKADESKEDGKRKPEEPKPEAERNETKSEGEKPGGEVTRKEDAPKDSATRKGEASKLADARLAQYAGYLAKLQDEARKTLPQRLNKRMGFEIVPQEEVTAALKTLQLTPEKMFENAGRMKGAKFPLPLPQAIQDIAKALHADAVVLGVLDEPRRANGKFFFDPLAGFGYDPGYVETHSGFYLMLPDGSEGLHGYMRVRNPLSKDAGRPFVLPDWIDAQDLMIENMMDEWTYAAGKTENAKRK